MGCDWAMSVWTIAHVKYQSVWTVAQFAYRVKIKYISMSVPRHVSV